MIEFRDSQKLALDHAGAHLALASADRQHGNIEQAIDHLTTAIKLEPYLTGARAELASLMLENGGDPAEIRQLNGEEADLLDRDTKLAPNNADIFYRLGLIRYLLGEYDKADAAFKKACELAPRNYDFRMALALLDEKRYEESGDASFYNATIESLKVLRELNREDDRGKQIYFKLQEARKQREGSASQPAEAPTTGPRL
jgi:tetratricopeptide (TPR) repeat protein